MAVAMLIFGVVLSLSLMAASVASDSVANTVARNDASNSARIAAQQLQRQVRSGNVLYAPTQDPVTGVWTLRVYTQVNGPNRCVQWRLDPSTNVLRTRSWSPMWQVDHAVRDWRVVGRNIVNSEEDSDEVPFVLATGAPYGGRLLRIHLIAAVPDSPAAPGHIRVSVTGRNTSFTFNPAVCSEAP